MSGKWPLSSSSTTATSISQGATCRRQKLDKKFLKLRFVGYGQESKGYRLLNDGSKKAIIRRDVIFNETDFGVSSESADVFDTVEASSHQGDDDMPATEKEYEELQESGNDSSRRSSRIRQPPVRFGVDEYADVLVEENVHHVVYQVCQIEEPTSMDEALKSKHAREWKIAADSEYQALIDNDTWELVRPLEGCKPIGSKWVFKVKHDNDGNIERFKGRLVSKGYAQKYGVDYDETFSPVVRFSSIRALLAYAVQKHLLIHQMDVVTAFLNGQVSLMKIFI